MCPEPEPPKRIDLPPIERRVLGVLIEKGLTTPEQYPLTLNALVNGCNQKSNRDPLTQYDEPQVEAALQSLILKGLAANATQFTARVERFSSQMGKAFELRSHEIAVIGELLLRGPQSEGELRQRASRMRPIETLEALREVLDKLKATTPPFVRRLSPESWSRGVRWTHACYPDGEIAKVIAAEAGRAPEDGGEEETAASAPPGTPPLREEVTALRARVASLEERLSKLERSLGV